MHDHNVSFPTQHAFHHSRARINSQTSPHACEEDPYKISR